MNYKKLSISAYIVVLLLCVWSCGEFVIKSSMGEYKKAITTLKYQMDYTDVYSGNNLYSDTIKAVAKDNKDEKTQETEEKIVYLTFDDGPSARTYEILDILKEYEIKATFFVVCPPKEADTEALKRAFAEGHTVGVHTASHSYKQIYKSVDDYLKDFETCFNYVLQATEKAPAIFRFPGGSVNNYNKEIVHELVDEMLRRGFSYFDWNVSSGDANKKYSVSSIYDAVISGCKKHKISVVLMHDSQGKKETVEALRQIIPQMLRDGYIFKAIDTSAAPVVFKLK